MQSVSWGARRRRDRGEESAGLPRPKKPHSLTELRRRDGKARVAGGCGHAGSLTRVPVCGQFSQGMARTSTLVGGRAPGFPPALPTGALPVGSLCSAVSPNPEPRPEEQRVFRATVNRQPCSLRGREGKHCHEGRSHRCLWAREATAAGPGGLRREQPLASRALSLSLGSAVVPHPGRPQPLKGNTSQWLDTARLAKRKMARGDTVYPEHRPRGTR